MIVMAKSIIILINLYKKKVLYIDEKLFYIENKRKILTVKWKLNAFFIRVLTDNTIFDYFRKTKIVSTC